MAALHDSPDLDLPDGNLPMADDDFEDLSTLSPKSRRNIKILLQEMKAEKVKLKSSKQGRLYVQYYEETDGSNVNRLCVPKSNKLQKLEDFFELIEFLKQHANPSGVVIDSDKVSLSQDLKYREGVEFEKLKEILGKGNSSEGDVYVIADKKPGVRHAVKTVAIKSFHANEIRCWMDLNDTGHVPKLYLIKLEENVVVIHMEALEPAIKFSEIIGGIYQH